MVGLLAVGGHDRGEPGLVAAPRHQPERVVAVRAPAAARASSTPAPSPAARPARRAPPPPRPGVGVHRVVVAERLGPVADHRQVDRVPGRPRRALPGRGRPAAPPRGSSRSRSASRHRGTRGRPSPAVAISSRWISFTPPPNVSTRVALGLDVQPATSSPWPRRPGRRAAPTTSSSSCAEPLQLLGGVHLGRRGVGDVAACSRRGHLPVEQLVDPQRGVGRGQRPADVGPARAAAARPARLGPRPSRAPGRTARRSGPAGPSITRSWLSWVVTSRQPAFSAPTRIVDRDPHVAVVRRVDVVRAVVR